MEPQIVRSRRGLAAGALLSLLLLGCAHEQAGGEAAQGSVLLPSSAAGPMEPWQTPPGAYLSERNRCVDRELARLDLNDFGDPRGTTYPGGSPLGVATAAGRYDYVLRRRPDIGVACNKAWREQER